MSARFPGRQRGMTLFVALILLVLMTLFAVSSFNLGKSSLQVVGNMQARNQALAAAQGTLEEAISATWFATTPANALSAPCLGTANTRCVDVNGDGVNDITVRLSPAPACLAVRTVQNATLNLALSIDAGCSTGVAQTFGIVGTATADSLCADTMWELTATAADNITQARATVVQGLTLRVSKDNSATNCP
jgi:Tfp pilus assembly protein PilX